MAIVRHTIKTVVPASAKDVWAWSTSIKGIEAEMWPVLKITFPRGMTHIDEDTTLDKSLGRCRFMLLGIFPIWGEAGAGTRDLNNIDWPAQQESNLRPSA